MSKKWMALFAGVVGSLAFVTGTMQGCGSSGGSGSDFKSLCNQGCDMIASCAGDADAATISQLKTQCHATCDAEPTNCSNNDDRVSAAKACLATSNCNCNIPPCQSTTGTGGSTGAGGTTGTGGTTGGGCSTCAKLDACCLALGATTTDCVSNSACMGQTAANQPAADSACAMGLNAIAMQPNVPAACR